MPLVFPLIRASGSSRQLGREHGEQATEQIRAFLDFLGRSLNLSSAELRARTGRFRPLFAAACPRLLDEVEGLAEGAGIHPADALAVQIRGELGPAAEGA